MSKFSLWNGRRKADTDRIEARIPAAGAVEFDPDNFCLESYRAFANGYYDLYNNGGCNWNLKGKMFQWVARQHKISGVNLRDMLREIDYKGYCNQLERLGDLVINAALKEQFGETEFRDQFL